MKYLHDVSYLRLSMADGDEKDESNSISSQRKCIDEYWKRLKTQTELTEFVDDGYSGTNFERPGFQRMLLLVKSGEVRTLIVKDMSRIGRNYLEVGYLLEQVLPYYNVRVISINDHFDSKKAADSTGGLALALKNLINECYSRDISGKISSAVHVKKMNGEYCYGAVPFGYKKGEKKNTIIPDEGAAWIVRYIFTLAGGGHTISQIAKRLNGEKVITPSKYLARPNYKIAENWSYTSVQNILTNRIYTGDTEAYKSHVKKVGSDAVNIIPEKERTVLENTHEPLVSREIYWKAREVVKSSKKRKKSGESSVLTGILVCGCCGNRLSKGKAANKYFLCRNRNYIPEGGCKDIRVHENNMLDILQNAVSIQIRMLEERHREAKKWRKSAQSKTQRLEAELSRLSFRQKRIAEENMRLYELFVEEKISKEEYLEQKTDNAALMKEYSRRTEQLTQEIQNMENQGIAQAKKYEHMEPVFAFGESEGLTREILEALVEKIMVMPDGGVEIYWKFMDELKGIKMFAPILTHP